MKSRFIMGAHQANFFPYLGFFDKLEKCDIFIIRDDVSYIKRDFHDRNKRRILSPEPKFDWIGILTEKDSTKGFLKDVKIKDGNRGKRPWKEDLMHGLSVSYDKTPYYKEYFSQIENIIEKYQDGMNLMDFNLEVINYISQCFGINTPIVKASKFGLRNSSDEVKSNPTQDLIDLCKIVDANCYLSGNGAKVYLEESLFEKQGVKLEYQNFVHPVYKQQMPGFLPNMSSVDALFSTGRFP